MRRRLVWLVLSAVLLLPMSAAAQDVVEYYGTDALGSVRIVFDVNGNVVGRMDYGPFGEQVTISTVGHKSYAGLFRDGEAGLDYAEARSYQVRTGRFNAPDPVYAALLQPQAWNRYSYAVGDPLGFTDTSGLEVQTVNCQLGAYWCPGQVFMGKPNESDKYFDPSRYGYHGGEEAARAEADYGAGVTASWGEFRKRQEREKDPKPSVTTEWTIVAQGHPATTAARLLGVAGEKAVRAVPVIGDKTPFFVNGVRRIADGMTATVVSEIKNVAYQAFTKQMADYFQFLRNNPGMNMDLYVRIGNGTQLSGPLKNQIQTFGDRVRVVPLIPR